MHPLVSNVLERGVTELRGDSPLIADGLDMYVSIINLQGDPNHDRYLLLQMAKALNDTLDHLLDERRAHNSRVMVGEFIEELPEFKQFMADLSSDDVLPDDLKDILEDIIIQGELYVVQP